MGSYTNNLFKKGRIKHLPMKEETTPKKAEANVERLLCCAIIRDGTTVAGEHSHASIRSRLGDKDIYESKDGDQEGFYTTKDRFVTRDEAKEVGVASGQLSEGWLGTRRQLLSSDIDWNRK